MKEIVKKCLSELIVSCQAYQDTPLYGADNIKKLVDCAVMGGARVVRCCWPQDIQAARQVSDDLIIVGINKVFSDKSKNGIFITPTFEDAKIVIEAGANIVALDTRITEKRTKEELYDLLKKIHDTYPDVGIMADCSTYEEGIFCAESGFVDILSTTLSGLANPNLNGPDIELLKKFKQETNLPVNAEGRIWELADIDSVVEAGADMITIGTAITRPHLITERFINHYNQVKNKTT